MSRVNKEYGFDFQLPVLFFTQLMGVALGVPESELGLNKCFIDPRPVLERHTTKVPA
jgi:heterodisulfide reductase subunit B